MQDVRWVRPHDDTVARARAMTRQIDKYDIRFPTYGTACQFRWGARDPNSGAQARTDARESPAVSAQVVETANPWATAAIRSTAHEQEQIDIILFIRRPHGPMSSPSALRRLPVRRTLPNRVRLGGSP